MSDLGRYLPGFDHVLDESDVVELSLNPDGAVWIERFGSAPVVIGNLTATFSERFIRFCAARSGHCLSEDQPILSTRVPGTLHRIEALLPPIVEAPSFSIRRHGAKVVPLCEFAGDARAEGIILAALAGRENIVVAGATSSGKTTLVNSCLSALAEIDPSSRLLVLEDTSELQPVSSNVLPMKSAGAVGLDRLLVSSLRLSPDRIVVGEVRTGAVLMTLLKCWNTGHPGGLTTVHADGALDVIDRFRMLASEVSVSDQSRFIFRAIDKVIFVARDVGAPVIRQIVQIHSNEQMESVYEYEADH